MVITDSRCLSRWLLRLRSPHTTVIA